MPTSYVDQFWIIDPFAPPAFGTTLTPVFFTLVDQDDDGDVGAGGGDTVDGQLIDSSFPGDTVTVFSGGSLVTVTGVTFYLADGREVFTPTDNSVLDTGFFVSSNAVFTSRPIDVGDLGPPCFTTGAQILLEGGRTAAVETLVAGQNVQCDDGVARPIRMIAKRHVNIREQARNPKLLPIRITAGSLGQGLPERDLLVSRQHRMLVSSPIAKRMFGTGEVLVPAIKLTDLPGIFEDPPERGITYFHLLFDSHQVIFAEGAPTESLYSGPEALRSLDPEAREEIETLFPGLLDSAEAPRPARLLPAGKRQKQLIARHARNRKPLLDSAWAA